MKSRLVSTLALAAFAVLLALYGTSALARRGQNTNTGGGTNTNTGGQMNSNTGSRTNTNTGSTMQGGAMASADRKFMSEAAMGGMAEVEMSRVALERATSDGVKQYAQRMMDDHTKANEELMQLAAAKGVTLPTTPDAKQAALLTRLRAMSGAEFDRMYLREAGVKAHEKMEKLFRKEATGGRDAETRAFASKTLPTVQMHLTMARDMANPRTANTNASSMTMQH